MKGTRLSEDWSPDTSMKLWARGRRVDLDIDEQVEMFRDYWCAKTGQAATKLDWNRTFRNWIRNARALPLSPAPPTKRHLTPEQTAQKTESIRREKVVGMPQQFSEILKTVLR